jgi:hypothetical protein
MNFEEYRSLKKGDLLQARRNLRDVVHCRWTKGKTYEVVGTYLGDPTITYDTPNEWIVFLDYELGFFDLVQLSNKSCAEEKQP